MKEKKDKLEKLKIKDLTFLKLTRPLILTWSFQRASLQNVKHHLQKTSTT